MTTSALLYLVSAATAAGVMNSMAGGGTILTYPTLVFLGLPAVSANATSTVGLLPGALASLYGYRREVSAHRDWLTTLLVPSLLGGALGAVLLMHTRDLAFARVAPFLILFATVLFMFQGLVSSWTGHHTAVARTRARLVTASLFQFGVSVYGGFFGAGIGILMLACLGFLGVGDIHAANGLKNFFGFCINSVAALTFIAHGKVAWPEAVVMIAGSIAGGYMGARFARHIGREWARRAVVVIGLAIAAALLYEQAR